MAIKIIEMGCIIYNGSRNIAIIEAYKKALWMKKILKEIGQNHYMFIV